MYALVLLYHPTDSKSSKRDRPISWDETGREKSWHLFLLNYLIESFNRRAPCKDIGTFLNLNDCIFEYLMIVYG